MAVNIFLTAILYYILLVHKELFLKRIST